MAKSRFSRNKIQSYTMAGKEKGAERVIERGATFKHTITNEAVTLATGAAGTTGIFSLKYSPIMNSTGAKLGAVGDTSLSINAVLDNEVKYKFDLTDAEQYAEMSNGDYAIDYDTGEVRYKKKTADTAITITYIKRTRDTELTVEGDIYVDNVKTFATNISDPTTQTYGLVDATGHVATNIAKIAGTATAVNTGNVSDGVQRVTIADDDTNASAINTSTASIDTKLTDKTQMSQITDGTNEVDVIATINSLKTDLSSVKGTATDVNSGNKSDGTLRVAIATDDINLALINSYTSRLLSSANTMNHATTLATTSFAVGGEYNATPPTFLDGESGAVQLDVNGRMMVATSIDTFDFATETTLSSIDTNVSDILTSVEATETLITDVVDTSSNLVRTAEQDPVIYHFLPEVIASVTNATDGTYPYYVDIDTFKRQGYQISADGGSGSVTITVEATMQDDGTAPASCTYEDVTLDAFGSASFVVTTADIFSLLDDAELLSMYKYIKIKVVADTSGANDADWIIRTKRLY